jgi:acyl-CoA hydrolase
MPSPRRLSAAEAAALVRSVDSLAIPLGPGQPQDFLHALGERDDYSELVVGAALLTGFYSVFARRGVRLLSAFHGPVERALRAQGHDVRFVPGDFRRAGPILRRMRPRIMATGATPPDASGMLSLSLHAGGTVDEILAAGRDPERLLVVEVNPKLPRTLGLPPAHPHAIPLEIVDVLIESERTPICLPESEPNPVEHAIAEHARRFIPDGATLQTGIGGVPSEIVKILARSELGDFGVHSEMFTDGLMALHRAGKVTNRKGLGNGYDGVSICTFAMGTAELYAWLDGNEEVRFVPVELVNDPGVIARNRRMVSINGALTIDLCGQVAADTLNGRQWSGIGGHEDFVAGGAMSEGGHSLVCLPAAASVNGELVSRIESRLVAGACVTTPRHQVDVIVTEYGAAELAGRTIDERAEALIAIAHPAFRERLRAEAHELLAWRMS